MQPHEVSLPSSSHREALRRISLHLRLVPLRLLCRRTTAFGFLNALCKLAAVLGISIFTSFVGITKAVPILFASGALAAGSFLALKLPETRGQVLQ